LFTVQLGGPLSPFPQGIFSGEPLWLGVQVEADPEMMPRTRLTSMPFAQRAEALRAGGTTSEDMPGALYTFQNGDPAGYALVAAGAIHVQGDAHVNGAVTWSERTGHITIPAAAFEAGNDAFEYNNSGAALYSDYGVNFVAAVNLPHYSTVTKMTLHYYDDTAGGDLTMYLRRFDLVTAVAFNMAEVTSSDGGIGSGYDDVISHSQVDNLGSSYYLHAEFGASTVDLKLHAVTIEYEFTGPY
jgi:hypothetical protein